MTGSVRRDVPSRRGPGAVAVLGSGPVGLSTAFHLMQAGVAATVFDPAPEAGGDLRWLVPPFRLPRRVLRDELARLESAGIEIRPGWQPADPSRDLSGFDLVVLADRVRRPRTLGVPGEADGGVMQGIDLLEAVHRGERPDLGARVVVVGGGVVALDAARTLKRLGVEPIVVYRRTRPHMPAPDRLVEETMRDGIELVYLSEPESLRHHGGRLVSVHLARMALGEAEPDGRRGVVPIRDGGYAIQADGIVTAIGEATGPRSEPVQLPSRWGPGVLEALGQAPPAIAAPAEVLAAAERSLPHALGLGRRLAAGITGGATGLRTLGAGTVASGRPDPAAAALAPRD